MSKTFYSSGDLGDVIACLPTIRKMGGGKLLLGTRPWTKPFTTERFDYIAPLLRMQPYITAVERWDDPTPKDITVDFSHFRSGWRGDETLVDMQARHAGFQPGEVDRQTPWITVDGVENHRKIVLCRSERHLGQLHWFRLWQAKHQDCLFIGTRGDYECFNINCSPFTPGRRMPYSIRYQETKDAIEAARLIKGSRAFVVNQTFHAWLGIAMQQPHMMIEQINLDTYFPSLPSVKYVMDANQNLSAREFQRM
jgi:hypothetical protein